tara:strand:+ start:970 stop:2634 length:1665 start_codon:yes stop_codon:yes gene_type:complete
MCGINFIKTNRRELICRINKMNQSLIHRGPDENGVININKCCSLGQTRLKILDLESAVSKQPKEQDGRYLAYNGEIVNYRALAIKYGYENVRSDTDFLFRALNDRGPSVVCPELEGMYAFIFVDTKKGTFYLHRDSFGIKPLYYFIDGEQMAISSEINGVLSSGLFQPTINSELVSQYFIQRHVEAPDTLITQINQLNPGQLLEYSIDTLKKQSDVTVFKTNDSNSHNDLSELLRGVIEEWCVSDVPVGTFLSGGLDSSLLTAISSEFSKINKAYCAKFENGVDESSYARQIADRYGIDLEIISVKEEQYLDLTEQLISLKGLPLGVPNEVAIYLISQRMKEDITVAISGEGADEFFGGYEGILNTTFSSWDEFYERYSYVPRSMIKKIGLNIHTNQVLQDPVSKEEIYTFFRTTHLQGLLSRVDSMTMLNSIESRPALVDGRILSYIKNQFTFDELSESGNGKKPLKDVALKYMPKHLVNRKKIGFPVPLNKYLDAIIERIEQITSESNYNSTINVTPIVNDLKNQKNGGQISWMLWNYLIWEKELLTQNYTY